MTEPTPAYMLLDVEGDGEDGPIHALRFFFETANQLSASTIPEAAEDYAQTPDGWEQVAYLKAAVRDAIDALRLAESQVDTALAECLPLDQMPLPALGCTVERGWSRPGKKWDGKRLVPVLAARLADEAAVDRLTGEVRPVGAIAEYVADGIAEAAGLYNASASWRTTALKAQGVEPRDFYDADAARQHVNLKGRAKR